MPAKSTQLSPKQLTSQQISHLRGLAHKLSPVIMFGKTGYSDAVHNELEIALSHHELIKIKLNQSDKSSRDELIKQIIAKSKAQLVQKIGQVLVIYRVTEKNVITFDK